MFLTILCGCQYGFYPPDKVENISDLAYDDNPAAGFTIYLEEADGLEPYIVLSNNHYGGNTLLLRKDALEEYIVFHERNNAYYAESYIDSYLNTTFYEALSEELQELILESDVEICKKSPNEHETETIKRHIFIPSCTEVGIEAGIITKEGSPISYFEMYGYVASIDGEPVSSWLRTTYDWGSGLAWTINLERVIGGIGVEWASHVRPMFCLSADTPVQKITDNEQEIYVLQYK